MSNKQSEINTSYIDGLGTHKVRLEISIEPGLPVISLSGCKSIIDKDLRAKLNIIMKNNSFKMPRQRIFINCNSNYPIKYTFKWELAIFIGILLADKQIILPENLKTFDIYAYGSIDLHGNIDSNIEDTAILSEAINSCGQIKIIPQKYCQYLQTKIYLNNVIFADNINTTIANLKTGRTINFQRGNSRNVSKNILEKSLESGDKEKPDEAIIYSHQQLAWQAIIMAVLGCHHTILIGSPGSGKTTLCRLAAEIAPDLLENEARDQYTYNVIADKLASDKYNQNIYLKNFLKTIENYYRPHFEEAKLQMNAKEFYGDISRNWPGILRLTANGIILFDEFNQFKSSIIATLKICLSNDYLEYYQKGYLTGVKSRFLCLATMNPCACGKFLENKSFCTCTSNAINNYWKYIDKAMLDRLDCTVILPNFKDSYIEGNNGNKIDCLAIRAKMNSIKEKQIWRLKRIGQPFRANGQLESADLQQIANIPSDAEAFLNEIIKQKKLNGRAQKKLLSLSRTVADWHGNDFITVKDIALANQLKQNLF